MKSRSVKSPAVFGLSLLLATTAGASDSRTAERHRLEGMIAGLADHDPEVRAEARIALMGLSPADLPTLHEVAAKRPLTPAEIAGLRDAVIYVLMHAAVGELPNRGEPFLGIWHAPVDGDGDSEDSPPPIGVIVMAVAPGLPASRYLLAGDVILGIDETIGEASETIWLTRPDDLTSIVRRCPPGRAVMLHVRRAGRMLRFAITPEARPRPLASVQADDTTELANILDQAADVAAAEFLQQFGPLIGEKAQAAD